MALNPLFPIGMPVPFINEMFVLARDGVNFEVNKISGLLCIETADRPGLLLEVVKIMADINVSVESAEIDTEGLIAKDKFHVSYRGAALNSSMSQEGGDWERKNRLKVYEGLYCMSTRNFKKAADLFLDSISTFTT